MTHLINDIYGVEVPEDAERFSFGFDSHNWIYYYLKSSFNSFNHRHIELPPGSYSIIGKGDELTEEQWEGIVEQWQYDFNGEKINGYKDYENAEIGGVEWKYEVHDWPFDHAKFSGYSLLKSKNLKPETTLLIKKDK